MPALRSFLGENDMMAYLVMMANRLLELHRVLKPTGSLYLHCDPTASHYLKIVLDGVFGPQQFRNEVIWKRANAHNDPKRYGNVTDKLLYFSKTDDVTWNQQYTPYREEYYESHFKQDENGRWFRTVPLDAPRHGAGSLGLLYDWKGKMPAQTRTWAIKKETMEQYEADGRLLYTRTGTPTLLQYADEMLGVPLQNLWTDIPPVNPQAAERLGYPTQKPLALLDRIINASSNEGDIVLDPFCGCGTAVHAAQKLGRRWIGIDITHLAVSLIEKRLKDAFPYLNRSKAEKSVADASGIAETVPEYLQTFEVIGTPEDLDGARNLAERNKYQFQWWACSLVNAQPYQGKKKGADGGIDGLIFFQDDKGTAKKIVVSVKGGDNVNVAMVRDLAHVVAREKAEIGLFVTLAEPSKPMTTEAIKEGFYTSPAINAEFPRIQILTIAGLLDGSESARYPDLSKGGHTFKKAKIDSGAKKDQGKLF